jgi:uncharacterized membrane protein YoaK (UPF0700 family)
VSALTRPVVRSDRLVVALFALTAVTGLVDAVSILALGRVFVANLTGNVVFVGFAVAGDHSFSAPRSLVASAAFLLGALLGGRLATLLSDDRRRWLVTAFTVESIVVAVAAVVAAATRSTASVQYGLLVLLGGGLGLQNATVRRVGTPDLTTTVLTLTLTGLAADSTPAGGTNPRWRRRAGAVVVMFAGAAVGGMLVLHAAAAWSLGLAAILLVAVVGLCTRLPDMQDHANERNATHGNRLG